MTWFFALQAAPTQVIGPGTMIILKLIDQAPSIIIALGTLGTTVLGLLNWKRLNRVEKQGNGTLARMITMHEDLATKLAGSVPSEALTAVASVAAATANAATAAASSRTVERAADRKADREFDRANVLIPDRRADAPSLKVDITSMPDSKEKDAKSSHTNEQKEK